MPLFNPSTSAGDFFPAVKSGSWVPTFMASAVAYGTATQDVEYTALILLRAGTVTGLGTYTNNTVASSVLRLGLRRDSDGYPGSVVIDAGTVATSASSGLKTITSLSQAITSGWYWFTVTNQVAGGVGVLMSNNRSLVTGPTSSPFPWSTAGYSQTGVTGALGSFSSTLTTATLVPIGFVQYA